MSKTTNQIMIVVRIGDNDFHASCKAALNQIAQGALDNDRREISVDEVHKAFPYVAASCYLTHQNWFEYNGMENGGHDDEIKSIHNYLNIDKDCIFVGNPKDFDVPDPAMTDHDVYAVTIDFAHDTVYEAYSL